MFVFIGRMNITFYETFDERQSIMRSIKQKLILLAGAIGIVGSVFACTMEDNGAKPQAQTHVSGESREISIVQAWSGDYPVSALQRLPEEQRTSRIGYIGEATTFTAVWQSFKPDESLPAIDWEKNLVVFTRNVDFYNRTNIFKVTVKDGVAEVLVMETRSALPIEDRVAMALAVIPREGIEFINAGERLLPVN
jgi:hypothetical protein